MELTFAQQTFAFFLSFVPGIAMAVLYGLIKLLRFVFSPGKAVTAVLDVLFMLTWALLIFYFSLAYLSGYIRFYVFAGSLAGFLCYRLTLGRLLFRIYRPIVVMTRRVLQKICEKIKIFAKYLLKIARQLLYNIKKKVQGFHIHQMQSHTDKGKLYEQQKVKHQKDSNKHRFLRRYGKQTESH